jgi:hypothetical protein
VDGPEATPPSTATVASTTRNERPDLVLVDLGPVGVGERDIGKG